MEKINYGFQGSVFKFKKNSKVYALKRIKIDEKKADEFKKIFKKKILLNDVVNTQLREIFFAKFIKKINKNHFLHFYKYKISKCPNYKPHFINGHHDTDEGKLEYEKRII